MTKSEGQFHVCEFVAVFWEVPERRFVSISKTAFEAGTC